MVRVIRKNQENLPEFDYQNGVVVVRPHTMEDENRAEKNAHIEFCLGKKGVEPSTREFMASLFKIIAKFYNSEQDYKEGNEKKFKASDILRMPSPFLTECFEELSLSGLTEQEEKDGK